MADRAALSWRLSRRTWIKSDLRYHAAAVRGDSGRGKMVGGQKLSSYQHKLPGLGLPPHERPAWVQSSPSQKPYRFSHCLRGCSTRKIRLYSMHTVMFFFRGKATHLESRIALSCLLSCYLLSCIGRLATESTFKVALLGHVGQTQRNRERMTRAQLISQSLVIG
jgi:hypothetical protein